MNSEDNIFELMTKMYGEMQKGFQQINQRIDRVEDEVTGLKKVVIKIENDHSAKLSALFEGYKQNHDQLERIELEVKRHDEFIIQRVK